MLKFERQPFNFKHMSTSEKYSKDGMGEGHPGHINPNEIGKSHPSKDIPEREKIDINESQLGREQGQTPADEHIDDSFSQIDNDTKEIRMNQSKNDSMEQTVKKEFDTDDFRRVDERDHEDSTEDWDAEKSRTGRQK